MDYTIDLTLTEKVIIQPVEDCTNDFITKCEPLNCLQKEPHFGSKHW